MYHSKGVFIFLILFLTSGILAAQENTNILEIIKKIHELEKDKDPKCYATANRLEDFMYGTPLDEEARNLKINIQKEIIYYLKEKGTAEAIKSGKNKITDSHLKPILTNISEYKINRNGDYQYKLTTGTITITKKDYNQYSSVSYGFRSLLSVEQDLIYFSESRLLPFDSEALQTANNYVNLLTLVTLKIADIKARKANEKVITKKRLQDTWVLILNESKNKNTFAKISYPRKTKKQLRQNEDQNTLVKEIIKQKLSSYETYNNIAENVFLRNIQVYFARQKWPTDSQISNTLRNYYLESLIQFTQGLLTQSNILASKDASPIIRIENVQNALYSFLPSHTNSFEDVTFFFQIIL